jgi:hypothetical protein
MFLRCQQCGASRTVAAIKVRGTRCPLRCCQHAHMPNALCWRPPSPQYVWLYCRLVSWPEQHAGPRPKRQHVTLSSVCPEAMACEHNRLLRPLSQCRRELAVHDMDPGAFNLKRQIGAASRPRENTHGVHVRSSNHQLSRKLSKPLGSLTTHRSQTRSCEHQLLTSTAIAHACQAQRALVGRLTSCSSLHCTTTVGPHSSATRPQRGRLNCSAV